MIGALVPLKVRLSISPDLLEFLTLVEYRWNILLPFIVAIVLIIKLGNFQQINLDIVVVHLAFYPN